MPQSDDILAVTAEELLVEKRWVPTGLVRVRTETETVQEIAAATLERQDVDVTRVPRNQPIEHAPPIRTEGDLTIIPIVEEVLVVEKRLVLREELHVRTRVSHERYEEPVTLRKQYAVVEHEDQRPISSSTKDTTP